MTKNLVAVAVAAAFAAGLGMGLLWRPAAIAHAQAGHVYELRTYITPPGRLEALKSRFRDHTIRIFKKHNMTAVGYWTPEDAPASDNTLIYILEHASRETAKANWAAFGKDPEWVKVRAASEQAAGGPLTAKPPDSVFLSPTDFSPVK